VGDGSANPYESPKPADKSVSPKSEIDVGMLVGNYLLILATMSVGWMLLSPFLGNSFQLDFSPIFNVWAGIRLRERKNGWRLGTIAVYTLALAIALMMVVFTFVFGTSNLTIQFGKSIERPQIGTVLLMASIIGLLASFPVVMLLTKNAKKQFEGS
jgi:hypothetical protein